MHSMIAVVFAHQRIFRAHSRGRYSQWLPAHGHTLPFFLFGEEDG